MTPERAFLQDVRDNPEDDAPRLICADWYEENGQPERAEFIRLQCRLARAPFALGSPALRRREAELLKKHGKQWRAPLKKFSNKVGFFRGFADHMVLGGLVFLEHAEELFRLAPVSHVKFRLRSDDRELFPRLACCPALAGLSTIDFQANKLGGDRLEGFFHSPYLTRLRHLKLNNNGLGNKGAVLLARSPLLGQLHSLDLTGNDIGAEGLGALVICPAFNLRSLDLTRNPRLRGEGIQVLAGSAQVAGLQTLVLGEMQPWSDNIPLDGDIQTLADSSRLVSLRTLDLAHNPTMGDQALLPLASTTKLPRLSHLRLSSCNVELGSRRGTHAWVEAPLLRRLERLDLDCCSVGPPGIRALAGLPRLDRLRSLDLAHSHDIWSTGANLLARAACLDRLTSLNLSFSGVRDGGARSLAGNPHLANLEVLDLGGNFLGSAGARALLQSPHLGRAVLCLHGNRIKPSDAGALLAEHGDRLDLDTPLSGALAEW